MFHFKLTLVAAALAFLSATVNAMIKVHFPASENDTYPRLRMFGTLPALREFTFCSWVRSYHLTANCSALLSYATSKYDNEIVVMFCKRNQDLSVTLWRGRVHIGMECPHKWKMNSWLHVCVTWFGYADAASLFLNGEKCQDVTFVSEDVVPSGGVLVIGQEQDAFDSRFERNAAFSGDLSEYHLWDEVLSDKQIVETAQCCGERREGNVISWMKTPMVPVQGVVISETNLCSCHKHHIQHNRGCVRQDYVNSC